MVQTAVQLLRSEVTFSDPHRHTKPQVPTTSDNTGVDFSSSDWTEQDVTPPTPTAHTHTLSAVSQYTFIRDFSPHTSIK